MEEKIVVSRRSFLRLSLVGAMGVLASGYTLFYERSQVQVNTYRIPVPNLPPQLAGIKLAHLTDIHLGRFLDASMLEWVVEKTNGIGADLIVCTGDYVTGYRQPDRVKAAWPVLTHLSAPLGVFAVMGNHDHWADEAASLNWLEKTGFGIRFRSVKVEKNGAYFWLAGAGDRIYDRDGIDRALENVPDTDCRIVLAHNPDTADLWWKSRVDLMICGHTHGGQVVLPFFGPPIVPTKNKDYTSGFIRGKKTNLFISRGVGVVAPPVRLNCFPEIAVLELEPEEKG